MISACKFCRVEQGQFKTRYALVVDVSARTSVLHQAQKSCHLWQGTDELKLS